MKARALKRSRYLGLAAAGTLALVIGLAPVFGTSSDQRIDRANERADEATRQAQDALERAEQASEQSTPAQQPNNDPGAPASDPSVSDSEETDDSRPDERATVPTPVTPAPTTVAPDPVAPRQIVRVPGNSISGNSIANRSIRGADIARETIGSEVIKDRAITSGKVAADAVTGRAVADDAITGDAIADDAVRAAALADGAITSAAVLDGAVQIADLSESVFASANSAGQLASRPAATLSNAGFLYFATDDTGGTLYRSDGQQWVKVAPGLEEVGSVSSGKAQPVSVGIVSPDSDVVWQNQPAAVAELGGSTRWQTRYDAGESLKARINVNVVAPGAAGATLLAEYSADGQSWTALGANSKEPQVDIDTSGLKTSKWTTIDPRARADVLLRIVGAGGNGSADPAFGRIDIQLRQQ